MNKEILRKVSFVKSSKIRESLMLKLLKLRYSTPKGLSEALGKHLSTTSRVLGELRMEGLVNFIEHEHSRSRLYYLTDIGKEVAKVLLGGATWGETREDGAQ